MVSGSISPQRESSVRAAHLYIHTSIFLYYLQAGGHWTRPQRPTTSQGPVLCSPCRLCCLLEPLTLALPTAGTVLLAAGLSLLPAVLPGVGWGAPAFISFIFF